MTSGRLVVIVMLTTNNFVALETKMIKSIREYNYNIRPMTRKYKVRKHNSFSVIDFFFIIATLSIVISLFSILRLDSLINRANYLLDSQVKFGASPFPLPSVKPVETELKLINDAYAVEAKEDPRIIKLKTFLKSKNSPLADYAELIVKEADNYDIGWTRLVAISGMESHYGLKIPSGSHNAWGLGGSKFMRFESWPEAISYASRQLGSNYKLNENSGIQAKYCPSSSGCNPEWAKVVTNNSKEILAMELVK